SRIERALAGGFPAPDSSRPPSERARPWRGRSDLELAAAMLLGDAAVQREAAWFVAEARAVRPALRGEDVTALGVPPGPEVARVLSALRDARLDGAVVERDDEQALVRHWLRRKEA
ncbi:MAG TPA: hypothetical protein VNO23_11200, partial [Candidatus Binatia bacterium]|nr:hypothetical protein [Candidatus Binatia bacterium]